MRVLVAGGRVVIECIQPGRVEIRTVDNSDHNCVVLDNDRDLESLLRFSQVLFSWRQAMALRDQGGVWLGPPDGFDRDLTVAEGTP